MVCAIRAAAASSVGRGGSFEDVQRSLGLIGIGPRLSSAPLRITLCIMQPQPDSEDVPGFIRRLMPRASETELREATDTFKRYMHVVRDICERINVESTGKDSPDAGVHDTL
jgi:hypothetical protein